LVRCPAMQESKSLGKIDGLQASDGIGVVALEG
jgi:hypothetical protein